MNCRLSLRCSCIAFIGLMHLCSPLSGAAAQTPPLAGHLNGVVDWSRDNVFVNMAKMSRGAYSLTRKDAGGNMAPANVGADGQPTEDFWLRVWDQGIPIPAGVYTITFKGPSTSIIDAGVSGGTLLDKGSKGGIRTYTFAPAAAPPNVLEFNFKKTQGLVKNVQVIQPGYSVTTPPFFTSAFLSLLKAVGPESLRMMDWHCTNGNIEMNWADRSLPLDPAFNTYSSRTVITEGGSSGLGTQTVISYDHGTPWEMAVQLANTSLKDLWINIPVLASDDYVKQLASLIKNGSTVNGVKYPGLKVGLHLYIEYSNEVWNDGFSQTHVNRQAAVNEVVSKSSSGTHLNGSDLNYDSIPLNTFKDWAGNTVYNGYVTWGDRLVARRIMQISRLFAGVWGESAINTTIRPVLAYQLASSRFDNMLNYLNRLYGKPSGYLYAIAVAPYFNAGNGAGLDSQTNLSQADVLGEMTTAVDDFKYSSSLGSVAYQGAFYGLKMLAYEGGSDTFGPNNIAAKKSASLSPLIQPIVQDYLTNWFQSGGDLFNWFTIGAGGFDSQYGTWSITDTLSNLTEPKVLGYQAVHKLPRPAVRIGNKVPGYIDARAVADNDPPFHSSFLQRFIGAGSTFHYLLNAPKAGTYQISLQVGNGDGKIEPLELSANNGGLVTLEAPATVSGTWAYTKAQNVILHPGLNGLEIVVPTERPYELNLIKVALANGSGAGVSPASSDFYSFYDSVAQGGTLVKLFNVSDPVTAATAITTSAASDNPILLPSSGVTVAKGDFTDQWGGHYNRKLTLVPAAKQSGTATVTLTLINSGNISRSAVAWGFKVTSSAADFQLNVPSSASVHIGGTSSAYPISVVAGAGFSGAVTYSVANVPSGITAAFSPSNSSTGTKVTFHVATSATPGPYTLNVVGTSGGVSHSYPIRLVLHP